MYLITIELMTVTCMFKKKTNQQQKPKPQQLTAADDQAAALQWCSVPVVHKPVWTRSNADFGLGSPSTLRR